MTAHRLVRSASLSVRAAHAAQLALLIAVIAALTVAAGCGSSAQTQADGGDAQVIPFGEPGPDATVSLGNEICAVRGGEVVPSRTMQYNGWLIYYCCLGCDRLFTGNLDTYFAEYHSIAGVDIRQSPTPELIEAVRAGEILPFESGG